MICLPYLCVQGSQHPHTPHHPPGVDLSVLCLNVAGGGDVARWANVAGGVYAKLPIFLFIFWNFSDLFQNRLVTF